MATAVCARSSAGAAASTAARAIAAPLKYSLSLNLIRALLVLLFGGALCVGDCARPSPARWARLCIGPRRSATMPRLKSAPRPEPVGPAAWHAGALVGTGTG